jgi:molybdenum cofactor biosynthesis enzyme MoaA
MRPALDNVPRIPLRSLDELWFQVAGTRCNLECTHCFISCSPHNDSFGFLSFEDVARMLEESVRWGVKEYYFTGGEPFLNPDLVPILCRTLEFGPATVLTNATVLKPRWLEQLREAEEPSRYSLEFRVSIDGPTAVLNDAVRGPRSFERAMNGVALLVEQGFLPILTMTRLWDEEREAEVLADFRRALIAIGYERPRIKVLPRLLIGAEERRTHGYAEFDRVTIEMMRDYDDSRLICSKSRIVTDRGVYVCPILIDLPEARMGNTLDEAATNFPIGHGACSTCYQYGSICTNPSSMQGKGG